MHFENKDLGPFQKTVSCFGKLWPEKNFWDYQTLLLAAQSAGTSCEPQQCYPRSRLEQVILVSRFHRCQIYLQRQFVVCKAETVRINPSAVANVCQTSVSCQHSASACRGRCWGPGTVRHGCRQNWSVLAGFDLAVWPDLVPSSWWVWACLCLDLLTYHSSLWLSIFSLVTGDYVSSSRRMFVPWWKGSGLQWDTGLAVASCLWLHPILAMW